MPSITVSRTIELTTPVVPPGYKLAQTVPTTIHRHNMGDPVMLIDTDDGDYGDVEPATCGDVGSIAWLLVRVTRDRPDAGIPLVPSDCCIRNGYTPPVSLTGEFRQPNIGEIYVGRRFKAGHKFARVFLVETQKESNEKADGRWIVVSQKRVAPAPAPAQRVWTFSAEQIQAMRARLAAIGVHDMALLNALS